MAAGFVGFDKALIFFSRAVRIWRLELQDIAENPARPGFAHTSLMFRWIVLITSSIFPLHTCLAMLRSNGSFEAGNPGLGAESSKYLHNL